MHEGKNESHNIIWALARQRVISDQNDMDLYGPGIGMLNCRAQRMMMLVATECGSTHDYQGFAICSMAVVLLGLSSC